MPSPSLRRPSSRRRALARLAGALLPPLAAGCAAPPTSSSLPLLPELPPPARGASPLLGIGYGLDHALVAVRDLEQAKDTYRDRLGFSGIATRGRVGLHAGGTHNSSAYFADVSYLELIGVHDEATARAAGSPLPGYLARREGLLSVAVATSSAALTAGHLEATGHRVRGPSPGSVRRPGAPAPTTPRWWTVGFEPPEPVPHFFIEYAGTDYRDIEENWDEGFAAAAQAPLHQHANGVLGLAAVWRVVADAEAARAGYQAMGFRVGGAFRSPVLGARGAVVFVKRHRILLLQPDEPGGVAGRFLREQGEGLLGLSLRVRSLAPTQAVLGRLSPTLQQPVPGVIAPQVLQVPPEQAHGAWLEFVAEA